MCLRPHRSPIAPIGRSSAARAIVYPLITHRSWLWEAPRSRARSCWATLRPDTDEMTATSDTIIAMRIRSLPLGIGDRGPRPGCDRRGWRCDSVPGSCGGGSWTISGMSHHGHRSARFVIRNGIVLFMDDSTRQRFTLSCVRQSSQGELAMADLDRDDLDPRVARSRAAVISAATELLVEARPVRGDDRRHRRPVGRRQVDDLPPLGVARRGAARRDGGLRARPRRCPTQRSAWRAGCARSPTASARCSTTPSGHACCPPCCC